MHFSKALVKQIASSMAKSDSEVERKLDIITIKSVKMANSIDVKTYRARDVYHLLLIKKYQSPHNVRKDGIKIYEWTEVLIRL